MAPSPFPPLPMFLPWRIGRKPHKFSAVVLIAVVKRNKVPKDLQDCTVLNPFIDIKQNVSDVMDNASSEAIHVLQASESILSGMLSCDGIVVFNTKAQVLAYNGFVRLKTSSALGGARMRAYHTISKASNRCFVAAFIHSHDGKCLFWRRDT
jgi:hypothetical protein